MASSTPAYAAPLVFNLDQNPPTEATDFKIIEDSKAYNVRADLPTGESVKVGITIERILAVVGERAIESRQEGCDGEDNKAKEFFQRAIPLPETVDETSITAQLDKHGHLMVYLPKKADITSQHQQSQALISAQ
uniref:SHSP domain-containing protein n=1 Tax=Tetraselmis chuii TaxID=63592 RepID=A0A7S1SKI9_9CHLO|mmetsp:Transcript_16873/g.30098  ORF Transcript_16873/g.30098 Transcript_16873/m.30098 type:complete len:134 (+) Transcript_16873:280-681(+)|eukprot:CAMPEP_0177776480 /NCGR_PEP_ID=MMETSP0491_2-20121128/14738_1 /TAXON_ID=63592 /ORGANISM="Tetraselmis chuii, Strain PLY429" /LENGTH=133 /DNA_ID=CAMNT_0019295279 /DNA_START=240 /DNA_END=641 /DNA_ORIENTATION=-